jgi:hypothetical protein
MFNPKKILAAAMLISLAAPLFFLVAFFIKQQHIQHEMKERLEYASLQTITIKKAEFKWLKKNKEIIIDGQLFDVKSLIINNNEIIVTGLFDHDENKLEKVFSSVMHQKKNETAPINKLILKFILTPVFLKAQAAFVSCPLRKTTSLYGFYQEAMVSQYYSIIVPPPII